MRLTLRTLLAYLDDTLEPAEAKLIGQKVAESDTAQALIARIQEVTRRRRLTTPPDTPGAKFDPNSIAEYLDNELTSESLAELEQTALASDVHLAELAACHQILTVVLGEPAVVPPSAYKRMYGLVKPPESNPRHQPAAQHDKVEALVEGKEVDETLRLGLPAFRSGNWKNGLILIGGAACALLLLALALRQVWPSRPGKAEGEGTNVAKAADTKKATPAIEPKADKPSGKTDVDSPAKTDVPGKDKEPEKDKQPEKDKAVENKDKKAEKDKGADAKDKKPVEDGALPPDAAVRVLGHFEPGARDPAVLLHLIADKKKPDRKQWTRLSRTPNQPTASEVLSNCPLVSLPGYRSVVQMDSGVNLTLWGSLPAISLQQFPFESIVVLHPSQAFDVDLTLIRGRISLANTKNQPLRVRVRFANPTQAEKLEIWDITLLEKGTDVIGTLVGFIPIGEPFFAKRDDHNRKGPVAQVDVLAITGSAELKIDLQASSVLKVPPAGRAMIWNSRTGGVSSFPVEVMPPWIQGVPPIPKEANPQLAKDRAGVLAALDSLGADLSDPLLDVGLANATKSNDMYKRKLVVRAAGAMDDLHRLIDTLEDKEPELRHEAIETLRYWIGTGRDNDYKLFEQLQPAYNAADAGIVLELLHGFTPALAAEPDVHSLLIGRLTHKKMAVREMSHEWLLAMFPSGKAINYNPAAPEFQMRQAAQEWEKLVKKGKVK